MIKRCIAAAAGGACLMLVPAGAAFAQVWVPGTEITGHAIQVETNGVVNTVHFDPGGQARIMTPGGTTVPATWSVQNNNLCLQTAAGTSECWTYNSAFQAGVPVTLTSNCQATSRWTALSTQPPMMPPTSVRSGERG